MDSNNAAVLAELRAKIPLKNILSFILFFVITFISFGELRLSKEGLVAITAWTAILYATSVILYNDAYSSSKEKALLTPTWEKTCAEHSALATVIRARQLAGKLEVFCQDVRQVIRRRYIRALLVGTGIDMDKYEAEISRLVKAEIWALTNDKGKRYPRKIRIRLLAATMVPEPKLYAEDLLHEAERAEKELQPLGPDGSERERKDKRMNMVSRALTSAVGGWLTVDFIANLSVSSFGLYLVRLFPLIMAIIIGNRKGTDNVLKYAMQHKRRQINYLTDFVSTMPEQAGATHMEVNDTYVANLPSATAPGNK